LANIISKLESDLERRLSNEKKLGETITLNEFKIKECEKEKKQVEKEVEHFAKENKDLEHQLKTEMKKGNDAYAEYLSNLSKEKQFTEEFKDKLIILKKEHKEALQEEKSGCAEKVKHVEAQKNTEIEELTAKIDQLKQDLVDLREEKKEFKRSESIGVSLADELGMLTTEQHEKEVQIKQIEQDISNANSSNDPERLKRLKEEKLALLQVLAKIQNDTFLAEQRAAYQQEQIEKIKNYS
jgi:chromosome segregation ATPase